MSSKLQISDDLSLPLDIITMRIAVYGDSGAGKTTFARLLAEKVHEAGQRFCAIDLKNDWWGLKSSADGASAGIPVVVFGGPRADVRLFEDGGPALADTITSIDQSSIIDLDAMSRRAQETFLGGRIDKSARFRRIPGFLDQLYEKNRRPLLLFCDEADRYAPQKPMTEDGILSLSSSEDIARRGRKRGIGSFWLTQRTAVLNKNVSEFANLVVIFRTPGSRDLKELEERVGRIADKQTVAEVVRQAPGLEDGQAFFLSAHPKLRRHMPVPVRPIQLPMPATFDSSATPGVGQRRREPKVLATTDLKAIEEKMAAQVQQARDDDPKLLRAELSKARQELTKLKSAPPAKPEKTIVEKPVVTDAQVKRVEGVASRIEAEGRKRIETAEKLAESGRELVQQAREFSAALAKAAGNVPTVPTRAPMPERMKLPPAHRTPPREPVAGDVGLGKCDRSILSVLAQFPEGCQKGKLTLLSGYQWTGSFSNALGKLRTLGFIEGPNTGTMRITDAGLKQGPFEQLPRGRALVDYWLSNPNFGKCERSILGALVESPAGMTKDELTEATGYEWTGSFSNALGSLRTAGVIVGRNTEAMRASEELLAAATA